MPRHDRCNRSPDCRPSRRPDRDTVAAVLHLPLFGAHGEDERQRALVWVDGRFTAILGRGLWVAWTVFREVKAEVIGVREPRLRHPALPAVLADPASLRFLDEVRVETGQVGLVTVDGRLAETLEPGRYAFWRDGARVSVRHVDLREQVIDVSGQEIMTVDKVTLRLNAVVTYRVADAARAVTAVESYEQALYREAQLALRAVIGARPLDALLSEKDEVASELEVLEKVAETAQLTVVLGETGLADRVVKLL